MPLPPAQFFVGLDWAAETHAVCVIDPEGRTLTQFVVEHSADGIRGLVSKLARFGDPIDVQVGIERPDGRLVGLIPNFRTVVFDVLRRFGAVLVERCCGFGGGFIA